MLLSSRSSSRLFKHSTQVWRRRLLSRSLTSAEVSTALRPFYFLVHPDLFGKFPKEQAVNEDSLKSLKSHLDVMVKERRTPRPINVNFYLKPHQSQRAQVSKAQARAGLKSVSLRLGGESRVRQTVLSILKEASLPTSYVDSIPESSGNSSSSSYDGSTTEFYAYDESYEAHHVSMGLHSMDLRHPLRDWLKVNTSDARTRMESNEPTRLQIERLQDELCCKLGLEDIVWECGWDLTHRRGALESFATLADNHPEVADILNGRSIVFGPFSGVDLDGQIILYNGEVRVNWLNAIKNVPSSKELLDIIPMVEKSLSTALCDIRVTRRRFQPITLVDDYRARLRQLLTIVNDVRSRGGFPASWPRSLSQFELCVESEASPLMVSQTGQFIVPANCPGFLLVNFITDHMAEAAALLESCGQEAEEEARLITLCLNQLGLVGLEREESIGSAAMVECCTRLLQHAVHLRHLTHGNHLFVTRYYSVLSDGSICIPWNWKEW